MELSFFFFLVLFISKKQRRSRQSRMVGIIQLSHKMREAQAGNYAYCDFFSLVLGGWGRERDLFLLFKCLKLII